MEKKGTITTKAQSKPAPKVSPEAAKGRVTKAAYLKALEKKYSKKDDLDYALGFIHVELEQTTFNKETGLKESSPAVIRYNRRDWSLCKNNLPLMGYNHIFVLHAPDGVDTSIKE